MSAITKFYCDQCKKEISDDALCWNDDNNNDFCSERCLDDYKLTRCKTRKGQRR